jgi:hypothetical protein
MSDNTLPQEEGGYGYEYISDHHGSGNGKEEHHIEPAVLVQSLSGEEASNGEGATTFGSPVPLCEAGSRPGDAQSLREAARVRIGGLEAGRDIAMCPAGMYASASAQRPPMSPHSLQRSRVSS